MNRRVLFINLEFPPLGGPGVQRILKFVRYLPGEGWIPTVICGNRSPWYSRKDPSLVEEVPSGVEVLRLPFKTIADGSGMAAKIISNILLRIPGAATGKQTTDHIKRNVIGSLHKVHPEPLLSWVYAAAKQAIDHHEKDGYDVVVTSGPPHISHMVGFILKRFRNLKWVADFRDPWVDTRLPSDRVGVSWRLHHLWESLVLRKADAIVSVSPTWARLLASKLSGLNGAKIHVVYNGYDPNDIAGCTYDTKDVQYDPSILKIHYNGTIQGAMLPDLFFGALAKLKREDPRIEGTLRCTFTGLPAAITDHAHKLELNGIVSDVGPLSHEESLQMAIDSDVLLLILNDADQTIKGRITGKVYEYVATGNNILAIIPTDGDLYAFLKNCQQCLVVRWDDSEAIVESLKWFIKRKMNGQLKRVRPADWTTQYTRQAQTRRLAEILNRVCSAGA